MTVSTSASFIRQCLLHRVSLDQFRELLRSRDAAVDGTRLFSALIRCRESICAPGDPLVSLYVEHLGVSGILHLSDAVLILVRRWGDGQGKMSQDGLMCLNATLQDLTMLVISLKHKSTKSEALKTLTIASRWLHAVARQGSNDESEHIAMDSGSIVESLAFFVASLAATDAGLEALSPTVVAKSEDADAPTRGLRLSLRQAFEVCLPLYSILSAQLVERINTVLKHISLLEQGATETRATSIQAAEMQAVQFQVTIAESQLVASKAGTVLFLESQLFSGLTIDDATAVNWLAVRHQTDYQAMFNDLITSSFSIMKVQGMSPDRALCAQQCQTFVQNKLPALLSLISATSFNSFSTEQAIADAWHQVMPSLSDQPMISCGAHFLHVCSLVHLLPGQTAVQLIGNEDLLKNLDRGLYTKDLLVDQVRGNHARGPKLVEELIRAEGSAGFISHAIVEIMHSYCHSKETQYLKDLANAIIRKPASVNCISLFIRPSVFLSPLCSLLDDWQWSEIHGEAQPVYDDFGAIFLLILVTRARLGLSNSELGIRKKDGFLSEYLKYEHSEQPLDALPTEKQSYLGDWINALYLAEGLSDDLFTKCSPHDFYLLIPTLLRQSVTAHQQGKLTYDSMKAGLDYLLEPFLLPSLVPALYWAGEALQDDVTIVGKVLEVLTKSPGSAESQEIHHTILSLSAPRLRVRLQSVSATEPIVQPTLKILNDCPGFSMTLEREVQHVSVELVNVLQHGLVNLITSHDTVHAGQQEGTHDVPALVTGVVEVRGVDAALQALLTVLLQLSGGHHFLLALDAIATTICVAEEELQSALRLQYHNLGRFLRTGDTLSAEAVVRLYRQVEAYRALLMVQDIGLETMFVQQLSNIDTANPDLDAATAISGGMDLPDDSGQPDGIDQVLDEVAAMGNLEPADADMSFDALYGLEGNDMDLNDLDLDMF